MNIRDYMEHSTALLKHIRHSPSKMFQMIAEDNWSHLGDHERIDLKKKLKEQPRNNPVDPVRMKSGAGGQ